MKISDVMTKTVANLNVEDTVKRAAELMKEHNIGSIPVCRDEKVVGIITDRDIAVRTVADGKNSLEQKVKDVMSSNPVVGKPEMDIHDAARIMSERQIRRLPIVENNNLVGIVALGDLAVENILVDDAGRALSEISSPSIPQM
ncbi:CBS domain-containing protein [Clostridium sp. JN-9]|uniref:CBS domain-containing protein n=1 Tax=Clostridium sp. JN-9 TaxID=2507159 RepID=UPI000FFE260A|nr:CBS domain-containing protein [Clostridium sp. JN-9]QAT39029.1 CBS domain-containing protein [Clostridium sp. JN-9]